MKLKLAKKGANKGKKVIGKVTFPKIKKIKIKRPTAPKRSKGGKYV